MTSRSCREGQTPDSYPLNKANNEVIGAKLTVERSGALLLSSDLGLKL